MKGYLLKRLVIMSLVLLGATVLVFFLARVIPGDPISTMLGSAQVANPEVVAEYRQRYGLDQPIYIQYFRWLLRLIQGDMGQSILDGRPVLSILISRFKATLILAFSAMLVAVVSGAIVGTLSAFVTTKRGNVFLDRFLGLGPLFFLTVPPFSLGLFLMILFAVKIPIFPPVGMVSITGGGIWDLLRHLVLPAVTMGAASAGATATIVRTSVLEVIREDYIRTAYAKGLSDAAVMFRHAFRNALIPLVTNTGIMFGSLLSNGVLVEAVFAWPGLGSMMVGAVLKRDYPLIEGGTIIIAATYVFVNLLVDISYSVINPKITYER
ncbi:MAG: ABC transporter permease [Firmicutes bacterium]|nr:ABC transporter permease [Bacillota bacterium]